MPIVRLMNNHPDYFKMALDLGAAGVVVPMVETAALARLAVEYCRYPPLGKRGSGPVRASNYFRHYDEYMAQANDEILLAVQIETIQTLPELDRILQVAGIDAVFVGPGDMEMSMQALPLRRKAAARPGRQPDIRESQKSRNSLWHPVRHSGRLRKTRSTGSDAFDGGR